MADLFGGDRVVATLDNWMRAAADALVVFRATVAAQLRAAPVLHADETSVRSAKATLGCMCAAPRC